MGPANSPGGAGVRRRLQVPGPDTSIFAFQWFADDAAIAGANGRTSTLTGTDEGKAFEVRVTYTDDAGNDESVTSPPARSRRPYALTAAASDGTVVLTWKLPIGWPYSTTYYGILRGRPQLGESEPLVLVEYAATGRTSYTDTDIEPGVLYVCEC